jgi:S1-C subfamily serine protease
LALIGLRTRSEVALHVLRSGHALRSNPIQVTLSPVPTDRLSVHHLGFEAEDTGESNGVIVKAVRDGGPAARMQLQPGDRIYALGDWEIRNTEDLLLFLQFVSPGDVVDVKILRTVGREQKRLEGSMKAE